NTRPHRVLRVNRNAEAFEQGGPPDAKTILLLQGWPDSPLGWKAVLPPLHEQGFRTIAPYLRGTSLPGRSPAFPSDGVAHPFSQGLDERSPPLVAGELRAFKRNSTGTPR